MRMLVVFEKGGALRHIGHLDLMRAMQRILRRTGLPVAYSQGFNPHMIVNFAAPLSVGAAGKREIMDVSLAQEVPEEVFLEKLSKVLPPALQAVKCRSVDDRFPALMAKLYAATYEIFVEDSAGQALHDSLPAFLAQKEIQAMRKTKSGEKPCDIRPMIINLSSAKAEGGYRFTGTLALREEATLKPDLLINSLSKFAGVQSPSYFLTRLALLSKGPEGDIIPLESL